MLKRLRKIRLKYRFGNKADFDINPGQSYFAIAQRVIIEHRLQIQGAGLGSHDLVNLDFIFFNENNNRLCKLI